MSVSCLSYNQRSNWLTRDYNARNQGSAEGNRTQPAPRRSFCPLFACFFLHCVSKAASSPPKIRAKFLSERCFAVFPEWPGSKTRKTPKEISVDIFKEFSVALALCRPGKPDRVLIGAVRLVSHPLIAAFCFSRLNLAFASPNSLNRQREKDGFRLQILYWGNEHGLCRH